jgi:hypothetical protein
MVMIWVWVQIRRKMLGFDIHIYKEMVCVLARHGELVVAT